MVSKLARTGPVLPAAPPWFVPYCAALGVGNSGVNRPDEKPPA